MLIYWRDVRDEMPSEAQETILCATDRGSVIVGWLEIDERYVYDSPEDAPHGADPDETVKECYLSTNYDSYDFLDSDVVYKPTNNHPAYPKAEVITHWMPMPQHPKVLKGEGV